METQPVKIVDTDKPIEVVDVSKEINREKKLVNKDDNKSLEPTTTHQEDVTKEGQRAINLIWERTQSRIALLVIRAGIYVNGTIIVMILMLTEVYKVEISSATVAVIAVSTGFINMIAGIVVGFYFSRTNHQKVGGVGSDRQEGR